MLCSAVLDKYIIPAPNTLHTSICARNHIFASNSSPVTASSAPPSFQDPLIRLPLNRSSTHRRPHIPFEALPIILQILRSLFVQRIRRIWLQEEELANRTLISNRTLPRQLFPTPAGQLTCIPTITAFKFNTGFQSSLKIFKQTFPSRSIFG